MALIDDLLAVDLRIDLTADQKRLEKYNIKGIAHRNTIASIVNTDQTLDDLQIRFTQTPRYDLARHWLVVMCRVWRSGAEVKLSLPLIFINPPISAPTGPGGRMQEDVRGAALRMIRGVVS